MTYRLLLVDGHNLLFRAFFGIPARIPGKEGGPIHGVVGFIGMLIKTVATLKPSHLLVVFDSEEGSFREEIDPAYKENRLKDWSNLPAEENPFSQLAGIRAVLDQLDCRYCEVAGVEADDVIATYSECYSAESEVVILSTDSDLLQLVTPQVKLFCPRGKISILYDPARVEEKYGVAPRLIPDFKALVGDKTDSIAGIRGVGPKTAQALLQKFGGIEAIFAALDAVQLSSLRQKLSDHRDLVKQNLALIRLNREIVPPFDLSELQISPESWNYKTMTLLRKAGVAR